MKNLRRKFIKNVTAGSADVAFGSIGLGFSSKSYYNIISANKRIGTKG